MLRRIVVIGGGQWQLPLIQYVKDKYGFVAVVDPYPTSPGVKFANEFFQEDITQIEAVAQLLSGKEWDAIISDQSDLGIECAVQIASKLGINFIPIEVMEVYCKKDKSRAFCKANHIPCPEYYVCSEWKDFLNLAENMSFPVVVKPSDSQSSRGITKLDNLDFESAKQAFFSASSNSRSGRIVLEAFCSGIELTAEGMCIGGEHRTLAVSSKKHFRTGIASELRYPAEVPENVVEKIITINNEYVKKSKLPFGITHAEYIYNPETSEIHLIEIACRGGGSLISSHVIPWLTNLDIYGSLIHGSLGNLETYPEVLNQGAALLKFYEFGKGKIKSIDGVQELANNPNVKFVEFNLKVGDVLAEASDDRSRQAYVLILAENSEEIRKTEEWINKTVRITFENDEYENI